MENIVDADYMRRRRVCKDFKTKNLGEHHDLYVQIDTSLLVDGFENFQNVYLEIYDLLTTRFLTTPGLVWQAAIKKIKVKSDLLTDIDMLLMVQKGIRKGICYAIH